jgi:hypothetical protein
VSPAGCSTHTELKRCLVKGRWRPISPMLLRVRPPASCLPGAGVLPYPGFHAHPTSVSSPTCSTRSFKERLTLDGTNLLAVKIRGRNDARRSRRAGAIGKIDNHRAAQALGSTATEFGAGQPKVFTQEVIHCQVVAHVEWPYAWSLMISDNLVIEDPLAFPE